MNKLSALLLAAVFCIVGALTAGASTTKTWTFTDASWSVAVDGQSDNWSATASGSSFNSESGICVTGGGTIFSTGNATTAGATYISRLYGITQIDIVYSTGSKGAGSIAVSVGGTEVGSLTTSDNTSETTYTIRGINATGAPAISVTANGLSGRTRNNVYVKSVTITYSELSFSLASGTYIGEQTLVISNLKNMAFQYTINGGAATNVAAGETAKVKLDVDADGNMQTYEVVATTMVDGAVGEESATTTYEIRNNKTTGYYELVSDRGTLTANDRIILVSGAYAMGAIKGSDNVRGGVAIENVGSAVYASDDVRVITLKDSGSQEFPWAMWVDGENGYLRASQVFVNTSTGLPVQSNIDDSASWSFNTNGEINNNSNADIRFTSSNQEFWACWYDYNYNDNVDVYRETAPTVKVEAYQCSANAGTEGLTWTDVADGDSYDTVTKLRFTSMTLGTKVRVEVQAPGSTDPIVYEYTITEEQTSIEQPIEEFTETGEYKFTITTSAYGIKSEPQTITMNIEGSTSKVEEINEATAKVIGINGGIRVTGSGHLTVVNAAGQTVISQAIEGQADINLASGFYIVTLNGKATKVIVR